MRRPLTAADAPRADRPDRLGPAEWYHPGPTVGAGSDGAVGYHRDAMRAIAPAALMLAIAGCASCPPLIDDDGCDLVTGTGARVWDMGADPDRRRAIAYIDAVILGLASHGYVMRPPDIGLWPPGALRYDGENVGSGKAVGGLAKRGARDCPIGVVWYPPPFHGAPALVHEELHRWGMTHEQMTAPEIVDMMQEITERANEASASP